MEAVYREEENKTYLLYAVQSKNEDFRGIISGGSTLLQCKFKKKIFPEKWVLEPTYIYCWIEYTCME